MVACRNSLFNISCSSSEGHVFFINERTLQCVYLYTILFRTPRGTRTRDTRLIKPPLLPTELPEQKEKPPVSYRQAVWLLLRGSKFLHCFFSNLYLCPASVHFAYLIWGYTRIATRICAWCSYIIPIFQFDKIECWRHCFPFWMIRFNYLIENSEYHKKQVLSLYRWYNYSLCLLFANTAKHLVGKDRVSNVTEKMQEYG